MKTTLYILSILLLISTSLHSQPVITKTDIDSLRINPPLHEFVSYLENIIVHARNELIKRRWQLIKSYYGFQASKKELELLLLQVSNLKSIYNLNLQLANKGDITDNELLNSHNTYLSKKIAVIVKKNECRNLILEIIRLCNLKILMNNEGVTDGKQRKTYSASD